MLGLGLLLGASCWKSLATCMQNQAARWKLLKAAAARMPATCPHVASATSHANAEPRPTILFLGEVKDLDMLCKKTMLPPSS